MLLTFPKTEQDLYLIEESTGVLWFKAADICLILGFSNPAAAISNHCPDDAKTIDYQSGRGRAGLFVSEPGMYLLIMESKSKVSGDFRQWLAREVLPQIRKTGSFNGVPNTESEGSEFLVLVDAAIARNLDPNRMFDWHKNYLSPGRAGMVDIKTGKTIKAAEEPTIDALAERLKEIAAKTENGILTAKFTRQQTRLVKSAAHAYQVFEALEKAGYGVRSNLDKSPRFQFQ